MSLWAVLLTGLFAGTLARRRPEVTTKAQASADTRSVPSDPVRARLGEAAPVGAFLVGKLASHVVLGAALGLVGEAVQIGRRVRAAMQIAAGIVMVLLALDLLGLVAVRGLMARGMRRPDSGVDPAEPTEVADLRTEIAELRGKPSGAGDA